MAKPVIEGFFVSLILGILVWIIFLLVSYVSGFSPVFEASLVASVLIQADVILFGFATIAAIYVSERLNVEGDTWITVALTSLLCYFFSIVSSVFWIFGALSNYSFVAFLPFSYTFIGVLFTTVFIGYSLLARSRETRAP